MNLQLNGEPREAAADTTITQLLLDTGLGTRRVAVEVNGEIVPRSAHAAHLLHEGDHVEIVHALGGG